jgi:hypothetical protein
MKSRGAQQRRGEGPILGRLCTPPVAALFWKHFPIALGSMVVIGIFLAAGEPADCANEATVETKIAMNEKATFADVFDIGTPL